MQLQIFKLAIVRIKTPDSTIICMQAASAGFIIKFYIYLTEEIQFNTKPDLLDM